MRAGWDEQAGLPARLRGAVLAHCHRVFQALDADSDVTEGSLYGISSNFLSPAGAFLRTRQKCSRQAAAADALSVNSANSGSKSSGTSSIPGSDSETGRRVMLWPSSRYFYNASVMSKPVHATGRIVRLSTVLSGCVVL